MARAARPGDPAGRSPLSAWICPQYVRVWGSSEHGYFRVPERCHSLLEVAIGVGSLRGVFAPVSRCIIVSSFSAHNFPRFLSYAFVGLRLCECLCEWVCVLTVGRMI